MAHYRHEFVEPAKAASQINQWVPVRGLSGASSVDETIVPAVATTEQILGMSIATVASPGDSAAFVTAGRAKAIAGASLGAWTPVGVGGASGMLVPIAAGGVASVVRNQVGISVQAAASGQIFTIIVRPEQLV